MKNGETRGIFLEWLKNYFGQEVVLPSDCEQTNFFDAGWIDSFGVIVLIEEVEHEFGFKFSEQSFQDRRFSSIGGLADMIFELKSETSNPSEKNSAA